MKRIYDIGANLGNFTQSNLSKYHDCEFVLVEANPNLIEDLKSKFENNKNVKVLNYCVSNNDSEYIDFYIYHSNPLSTASKKWMTNSRFSDHYERKVYNEPIKIESISLETLVEKYGNSDYIKIDVEGYENVVISGLKSNIGLISFEWAEEFKSEIIESVNKLNELGYKDYNISYSDNYLYIPEKFISYDNILNELNNLNEFRKDKWGMIFAK